MEKLLEILNKIKPEANIDENTRLVDNGILTSFEMFKLVMEINNAFDIEIEPLDMTESNFSTPLTILNLIKKLEEE